MLLADLLKIAGAISPDEARDPSAVDLNTIERFTFGERYEIHRTTGKVHQIDDLETILSVVQDEFDLWRNQYRPDVQLGGRSGISPMTASYAANQLLGRAGRPQGGLPHADHRVLVVKAAKVGSFLPVVPVEVYVNQLRVIITTYNLTGTWDQFEKGNL